MSPHRAFIVVPFERIGTRLGPRQVLIVQEGEKARAFAQDLALRLPGVAVIERRVDPDTGDDTDILVAEFGAIPPMFPSSINWSIALH